MSAPTSPVEPRFTAKSIGEQVNDGRRRRKWTVVKITERLRMIRTLWYDKIKGTKPFSLREVGLIASMLDAPKGWPIVPWDEGLKWEEHLADLQRKRDQTAHR